MKGYIEIAGLIKHQTEKAVLFHDGTKDVWIAKSPWKCTSSSSG